MRVRPILRHPSARPGRRGTTVLIASALLSAGLIIGFAPPAQALEDDVQACAVAYEQAQVTRNAGQLLEAQEHLRVCVRDVCPEFVKVDCGQWLSEVKREMPSVIFVAVDEQGKELSDVQVNVNGNSVLDSLDGKSVELNPGKHEVQFTHQGKGVRQDVIVRQAEKNRVVRAVFSLIEDQDGDGIGDEQDACPTEVGAAEHQGCPAPLMVVPQSGGGNGLRVGAYVGWGLGAAGLGTFAVAGLLARNTTDEALKACPNGACPTDRKEYWKNRERREVVIANTGLAVGVAGVVTGTVLFLLSNGQRRPEQSERQVSWSASPIESGGGMVSISGAF